MTWGEYRELYAGSRHTLADHYADGFRNGRKRVGDDPQWRDYFGAMALGAAKGPYSHWPPYRAYQLGFARGARTA